MRTVITISRTVGSGGAEVGRMIAGRLGFRYADQVVLARAARRLGLSEIELSSREERVRSFWDDIRDVFALGPAGAPYTPAPLNPISDQEIFAEESRIMKVLAERHDCVVIGRGGCYVFREHPRAVHVLLHAALEYRIERVLRVRDLRSEEEARRMIEEYDRARTAFRAELSRDDPLRATQYDLCIDTGGLALERVAALIVDYYEARFPGAEGGRGIG